MSERYTLMEFMVAVIVILVIVLLVTFEVLT